MKEQCCICKKYFDLEELYEYREKVACEKDFEKAQQIAESERAEIMRKSCVKNHHVIRKSMRL